MPGKQAGPGNACWPDRLIGDMPNIYLYAANNPSEATLAKRRTGAVTVTHLTPPLAVAGLYKGLTELKDSLTRWREMAGDAPERAELEALIAEQAAAVDLDGTDIDGALAAPAGNRSRRSSPKACTSGPPDDGRGPCRVSRPDGRCR